MFTKSEKIFSFIFICLLIIELITGHYKNLSDLHFIAKPALLIALAIYFYKHSIHLKRKTRTLMLLALSFSLLGDILLMFVNYSPHYFTSGLIAFLLAHVFFILVFLQNRNTSKKPITFFILILGYANVLFIYLKDGLGDMLIPVLIYMLVILTMSITAFLRYKKVNIKSFYFVFIGAILFMISDSILALNKFYKPLPLSNISIMATYAFAQISIVFGIIKQR